MWKWAWCKTWLLCHAFPEEDYAWGFQRNLKVLDLSLAWLSTGFPLKKNYNTKNPSLPQTLCQAEGCYLWGNIDVTTKTPQEKTSCCCLILQDHLSLYKRNSNAANWRCFWERQRIWLCDRHVSTSCRAALRTRCHALWGHSPRCCQCRIVPHRVTGLGITSSPVLIQPDIELYWELL